MPRRQTSLSNNGALAVSREINSKYDVVKAVSLKLNEIEMVAGANVDELIQLLNEALDFTGIIVVSGEEAGWDPTHKVITIPTVQGEPGLPGEPGADGADGVDGVNGKRGLTPVTTWSVNEEGDLLYETTYKAYESTSPAVEDALRPTIALSVDANGDLLYEVTYIEI